MPTGYDRAWNGVSGAMTGSSWMVGIGGRIATIEEDHVRSRSAGPTTSIRAMGSMGGALVAAGEWGHMMRETSEGFVAAETPTESALAAMLQISEGRLLAIGDFGAMVDIDFDSAELIESPTRNSLRAGIVSNDHVLVVGSEGTVVRGTIGQLVATRLEDVGDLWSVSGTPDDAIVVGDGGVVVRLSSGGNRRSSCGEMVLRGVIRTADGTWAVGDRGYIARIEGTACEVEHEGGPTLHAIGVSPEGGLLAVGDEGTAITRGGDGTWSDTSLEVGSVSLRTIWRSDRDVYVAGTGGAIVRHIRLDR
jgi:hypothetical protein